MGASGTHRGYAHYAALKSEWAAQMSGGRVSPVTLPRLSRQAFVMFCEWLTSDADRSRSFSTIVRSVGGLAVQNGDTDWTGIKGSRLSSRGWRGSGALMRNNTHTRLRGSFVSCSRRQGRAGHTAPAGGGGGGPSQGTDWLFLWMEATGDAEGHAAPLHGDGPQRTVGARAGHRNGLRRRRKKEK